MTSSMKSGSLVHFYAGFDMRIAAMPIVTTDKTPSGTYSVLVQVPGAPHRAPAGEIHLQGSTYRFAADAASPLSAMHDTDADDLAYLTGLLERAAEDL